jgi:hypothetical protein
MIMRLKINFLLFPILLFPIFLSAQDKGIGTYLFDNFEKGAAIYKNGTQISGIFNYDVLSGKVLFKDENKIMELIGSDDIPHVKINNRLFTYIKDNVYYEQISAGDGSLFVFWKYKIVPKGKNAGYGVTSQLASISNVSMLNQEGIGIQSLKSVNKFEIVDESTYYLYINGKYRNFNSERSFIKLFKTNNEEISTYIKEEKIDFTNLDDMIKLIGVFSKYIK